MKAIIIEDQPIQADSLIQLIETHCPEVEIIDSFPSRETGIEGIKKHRPDIVFLDIQMETPMAGFELLSAFPKRTFEVIFTTSHDTHALQAFEVYPIDFLLKPVEPQRLIKAVEKVCLRKVPLVSDEMLESIKRLYENPLLEKNKIGIPTMQGCEFIRVDDIIRCSTATRNGNQTLFYLQSRTNPILCAKTLSSVEKTLLHGYGFCRIHQSHLINRVHMVRYIKPSGSGSTGGLLTMMDGETLPVSRSGRNKLFG